MVGLGDEPSNWPELVGICQFYLRRNTNQTPSHRHYIEIFPYLTESILHLEVELSSPPLLSGLTLEHHEVFDVRLLIEIDVPANGFIKSNKI